MRSAAYFCFTLLLSLTGSEAHAKGKRKMPVQGTHIVRSGDTLWDIAQSIGCRVGDVQSANDMTPKSPLRIGESLSLPRCGGATPSAKVHVVAAGDTLSAIAASHNTSVEALQAANGLTNTVIRVGQRLTVGSLSPVLPLRVVSGQSVGRPQRGKLVDGVRLPHDPGYYRRRVERAYGAQHAVDHTRRAIATVRTKYPGLHRLAIGDLSAKKGGSISGHASHQSGRDIDLGLYFTSKPEGYPQAFVRARDGKLHQAATWELVYALYRASKQSGGPQKIFLNYKVQGKLYDHANKRGVSKTVLAKIFQYPKGRYARGRLVSHEPHHADHLHVRFSCPTGDSGCK